MTFVVDIDLRQQLGPPGDQGRRPTCMAFATTAAHECHRGGQLLSVEYLYYAGLKRSHNDPTRGLSLRSAAEALDEVGQPDSDYWTYSPVVATPYQPPSGSPVHLFASTKYAGLAVAGLRTYLEAGTPVVLGIGLTRAFFSPDKGGLIGPSAHDTREIAQHAVLAVGAGHDSANAYILVRNSWGVGWGDEGHGWLTANYLTEHLKEAAVVMGR